MTQDVITQDETLEVIEAAYAALLMMPHDSLIRHTMETQNAMAGCRWAISSLIDVSEADIQNDREQEAERKRANEKRATV